MLGSYIWIQKFIRKIVGEDTSFSLIWLRSRNGLSNNCHIKNKNKKAHTAYRKLPSPGPFSHYLGDRTETKYSIHHMQHWTHHCLDTASSAEEWLLWGSPWWHHRDNHPWEDKQNCWRGLKASGQVAQRNAAFCSPNPSSKSTRQWIRGVCPLGCTSLLVSHCPREPAAQCKHRVQIWVSTQSRLYVSNPLSLSRCKGWWQRDWLPGRLLGAQGNAGSTRTSRDS